MTWTAFWIGLVMMAGACGGGPGGPYPDVVEEGLDETDRGTDEFPA